jgi:DNA-binding MarR family transcriptional regulator
LAGASVLRVSHPEQDVPPSAEANLDDYELVRNLLCSVITGTRFAAHEPLAVDMINRANVYLWARYGRGQSNLTASEAETLDYLARYGGHPTRRELITRRELADLGNVKSATVNCLVEQLQGARRGREAFLRMGIVGERVTDRVWQRTSARELARSLRPWSAKQVRAHFDRLRRDGLITAERDAANGPWRYELPEEISDASSPFSDLPTAHELDADSSAD